MEIKRINRFYKIIKYTYEDSSPWETERGRRLPKYVKASIGYQVIHDTPPWTPQQQFYGFNGEYAVFKGERKDT